MPLHIRTPNASDDGEHKNEHIAMRYHDHRKRVRNLLSVAFPQRDKERESNNKGPVEEDGSGNDRADQNDER